MNVQEGHSFGTSKYLKTADGRKLHYMVKGSGQPTVIFDSGMGFSRSTWGLVQPVIGERVRAVVYDRAGFGKSDPDTGPRTLGRMAGDLGALLTELGSGPFLLVGHSWGGPIVRTAAAADPARICGVILVDPTDEHCELYYKSISKMNFAMSRHMIPMMARLGLYKRLGAKPGSVQPPDVTADHHREDFTLQAARTTAAESAAMLDEMVKLRKAPPDLQGLPLTIISGTLTAGAERMVRPAVIAAHKQSVAKTAVGRWVEAARSGHMVNYSEPNIIVDEILRMLEGEGSV